MPRKKDPAGPVIAAAMHLAALNGWRNVSLYDMAVEAGIGLDELTAVFPNREAVLAGIAAQADRAMLDAVDDDWADETVRDRLFALMIARFDALKDRREGLRSVLAALPADPAAAFCLAAGPGHRSMRLALEAAGVSSAGIRGALAVKALSVAYLSVFRTFLNDDSADLSATMAALDRALGRLDRLAMRVRRPGRFFGRKDGAEAADEPATFGEPA